MQNQDSRAGEVSTKGSGSVKGLIVLLFVYVLLLSGGLGIVHIPGVALPLVVRNAIESNTSVLRAAAAGGLAGLISLLVFHRKRTVSKAPPIVRSRPMVFEKQENLHPLFLTPRPSRDKRFIIRKTRRRGRIYRNRGGEKILHTVAEIEKSKE